MAKSRKPFLKLDEKQIGRILQNTKPLVHETAKAVAGNVQGWDKPVDVYDTVSKTGRPVSLVVLSHPSALAVQAKHGVLTRAAAAQGLDVHRW